VGQGTFDRLLSWHNDRWFRIVRASGDAYGTIVYWEKRPEPLAANQYADPGGREAGAAVERADDDDGIRGGIEWAGDGHLSLAPQR
jgi:hypothetical protein